MNPYARWIQNLPRVDTPFDGLEGRMISGPEGQAVFFRAAERFEVPPHAHGAQWGIVVTGLLHLTVDSAPATYRPGETYDIPAGAEHSAILESETCVIDVFQDSDRYSPEKQRSAEAVKDHQLIPWTQPGWFGRVSAQVHAELQRQGITVSGPIEQPHSYPWSTVLRVPTGEGNVFFKAVSPAHPHEPALIEALARWSPDQVPRLLSVDTERGWILMRDAGRRLRELVSPTRNMRPWLPVLPRYAELQIELLRRVPDLLALGVPDRRLQVLPTLYEPLLADVDVLRVDQTPGLTRGQYERLLNLAPRVAELGGRLAEYRIPETLNHGDLTDGNAFVDDGSPVFIDWGDACVSHPFYSLRTVLVSAEISLRLEENSPELRPLRDAYMQPWTRFESRRDLLEALDLAGRLASINGALTWHRLVSRLKGARREE